MKTLQQEYQLIKEGKGNKDHFLKVARHIFPEYITTGNNFDSAIHILKSKSLLSEGVGGVITQSTKQPDWFKIFNENLKEAVGEETYALNNQEIKEKSPITNMSIIDIYNLLSEIDDIDFIQEIGIIISRKDWNNRGEFAAKQKIYREIQKHIDDQNIVNDLKEEIYRLMKASSKELNEAIGVKNTKEYGNQNEFEKIDKDVAKDLANQFDNKNEKNIDNVYGQSFLMGFYTEMQDEKNKDKSVYELKQIVLKNMVKNINYYATEASFGVKGIGYKKDVVGGEPVDPKGKYKSSGYGDIPKSKPVKESQEFRSVGSRIKPEGFQVGDKVKYKGMNYEITRIIDDRIYIKNLKYNKRPDTWVKAIDLKKSLSEIKRIPITNEMKEVEKSSQSAALEVKLKAIDEAIEKRKAKLSLAESEELAEMIDPSMIKILNKEIKELEKHKAKTQKIYEKMTGKAKEEVIDEDNDMMSY